MRNTIKLLARWFNIPYEPALNQRVFYCSSKKPPSPIRHFVGSVAVAAEDEAALKEQMHKACAPLFDAGGACADLAKGTRNCTRQNLDKGGAGN